MLLQHGNDDLALSRMIFGNKNLQRTMTSGIE
jgi:hypothetical protein